MKEYQAVSSQIRDEGDGLGEEVMKEVGESVGKEVGREVGRDVGREVGDVLSEKLSEQRRSVIAISVFVLICMATVLLLPDPPAGEGTSDKNLADLQAADRRKHDSMFPEADDDLEEAARQPWELQVSGSSFSDYLPPLNPHFDPAADPAADLDTHSLANPLARVTVLSLLPGADPSGTRLSTEPIQQTIDALHDAGGGIAVLPLIYNPDADPDTDAHSQPNNSTIYLSGPITLKSNVHLSIPSGVTLKAAGDKALYNDQKWTGNRFDLPVFLAAKHAQNIAILGNIHYNHTNNNTNNSDIPKLSTGGGIIDGQALTNFVINYDPTDERLIPLQWTGPPHNCTNECRPRLVQITQCQDVRLNGITLRNSPDWTLRLLGSTNIHITNMAIEGDSEFPNNDGIDIDSSQDVTIKNVRIHTGDDAICLKSTSPYGPTSNILIESNTLQSHSAALKIGSATEHDIQKVIFRNIYIENPTNVAMKIQHRDRGNVKQILFQNIYVEGLRQFTSHWWGNGEAIHISSIPRNINQQDRMGRIEQIILRNIYVHSSMGPSVVLSRTPIPISDITFHQVELNVGANDPTIQKMRVGPLQYIDPSNGAIYSALGVDLRPTTMLPDIDQHLGIIPCSFQFQHYKTTNHQNQDQQQQQQQYHGELISCDGIHFENVKLVNIKQTTIAWIDEIHGDCIGYNNDYNQTQFDYTHYSSSSTTTTTWDFPTNNIMIDNETTCIDNTNNN